MEPEMLPVYVATAMVVAHGCAAAAVAQEEALKSFDRGDIEKMRVWRTVAGVADLALACDPTAGAGLRSASLRFHHLS